MRREAGEKEHRSVADARERRTAAGEREEQSATSGRNERRADFGGRRHHVYIVWLTPKTKICEAGASEHARASERENASETSAHAKKECRFDELEVGDRVEIEFNPEEDSAAHSNVHQNQQMRQQTWPSPYPCRLCDGDHDLATQGAWSIELGT